MCAKDLQFRFNSRRFRSQSNTFHKMNFGFICRLKISISMEALLFNAYALNEVHLKIKSFGYTPVSTLHFTIQKRIS